MPDPLAGHRERINENHRLDSIAWEVKVCPVEEGQIFKLRTCHIEITRKKRQREFGRSVWRAWFRRSYPEGRVYLLAKSAGDDGHGYTSDDDAALDAQDEGATTIATVDPLDNPANLTVPPEPEAVPPHEISTYTGSALARRRFEHEVERERVEHANSALEVRLAAVRVQARRYHVDITSDVRVVEKRLANMEQKVGRGRSAA